MPCRICGLFQLELMLPCNYALMTAPTLYPVTTVIAVMKINEVGHTGKFEFISLGNIKNSVKTIELEAGKCTT